MSLDKTYCANEKTLAECKDCSRNIEFAMKGKLVEQVWLSYLKEIGNDGKCRNYEPTSLSK